MNQIPVALRWEGLRRVLWQERLVLLYVAGTCAAISVVFVVVQAGPEQREFVDDWLRAYRWRPWGVVSAIFVHFEADHYPANLGGLVGFLGFLALANWSFELAAGRRILFPIGAMFLNAASANLLSVLIIPPSSPGSSPFGASGLVYALIGATVGLALLNVPFYWRLMRRVIRNEEDSPRFVRALLATNLFLCSFLLFLLYPAQFFGVGQSNALGHLVSFVGGLFVTYFYGLRLLELRR